MCKFKVGDIVVGTSAMYGITGVGWVGVVKRLIPATNNDECSDITVAVISGSKEEFPVSSKYFKLYKRYNKGYLSSPCS